MKLKLKKNFRKTTGSVCIPYTAGCIGGITMACLHLTLAACSNENKKYNYPDSPNIIVILADDLGWGDVGFHGSEIKTPTLDKMASMGAEFHRFYVHSVCSPTRASLLTGRFPSRFGINAPMSVGPAFPEGTMTMASLLKEHGYQTAISGKWHLGTVPEALPMKQGFDSSYGYLRGQIDPYTHLYKNGDRTWQRNDSLFDEEGHATDLITDEAIRFIKISSGQNKPFFLYVAYSVPHYPLEEPQEWISEYTDIIENKSRRNFAASVSHMDYAIGRLLSTLEEQGVDKNSLILFLSDNGAQENWSSETQYNGKFEAHDVLGNNLPLHDWKTSLHEGALRVPALLYWPDSVGHQKITESINVADVLPTLAHLVGAKISEEATIDGLNFWPALNGEELPNSRLMFWQIQNSFALKKGDWKLIHHGKNLEQGSDE